MKVKDLRSDLLIYLKKHNLENKFNKQINLLLQNSKHPSLNIEILEPKHRKIYSFRINHKYRAIFGFTKNDEIEIVDINDHYQ